MQALLHVGKMLASTILICREVKHMVHGDGDEGVMWAGIEVAAEWGQA
jgi:hypothetical protein